MSGKSEKKETKAIEPTDNDTSSRHAVKLGDVDAGKMKVSKVEQSPEGSTTPFRRVHYQYEFDDGEKDLMEVRHPDYAECYISRREDTKENKKGEKYKVVKYSVSVYFDVEKDKDRLAAIQKLDDCFVVACGTVKNDLVFGSQNFSKKKFVAGGEEAGRTELWYSMIQDVENKPKRRKVKFNCQWNGQKPHLKRFLSEKEREALRKKIADEKGIKEGTPDYEKIKVPKTEELDADMFLGGKCLQLRSLRSQHPNTHFGEKAWPKKFFYSAVVMGVVKKGAIPDDLDDDEYDGAAEATDLDALAAEVNKIKSMPIVLDGGRGKKPAAAGGKDKSDKGEKDSAEIKTGEAKINENEQIQTQLAKLKERKLAEKAKKEAEAGEKKASPKKDEEEEEPAEEKPKKEKKDKKKKSPKKDEDDE